MAAELPRQLFPLHAHVTAEERGERAVPKRGDKGCLTLSPAPGGPSHGGMQQAWVGVLNIKSKTEKEIKKLYPWVLKWLL